MSHDSLADEATTHLSENMEGESRHPSPLTGVNANSESGQVIMAPEPEINEDDEASKYFLRTMRDFADTSDQQQQQDTNSLEMAEMIETQTAILQNTDPCLPRPKGPLNMASQAPNETLQARARLRNVPSKETPSLDQQASQEPPSLDQQQASQDQDRNPPSKEIPNNILARVRKVDDSLPEGWRRKNRVRFERQDLRISKGSGKGEIGGDKGADNEKSHISRPAKRQKFMGQNEGDSVRARNIADKGVGNENSHTSRPTKRQKSMGLTELNLGNEGDSVVASHVADKGVGNENSYTSRPTRRRKSMGLTELNLGNESDSVVASHVADRGPDKGDAYASSRPRKGKGKVLVINLESDDDHFEESGGIQKSGGIKESGGIQQSGRIKEPNRTKPQSQPTHLMPMPTPHGNYNTFLTRTNFGQPYTLENDNTYPLFDPNTYHNLTLSPARRPISPPPLHIDMASPFTLANPPPPYVSPYAPAPPSANADTSTFSFGLVKPAPLVYISPFAVRSRDGYKQRKLSPAPYVAPYTGYNNPSSSSFSTNSNPNPNSTPTANTTANPNLYPQIANSINNLITSSQARENRNERFENAPPRLKFWRSGLMKNFELAEMEEAWGGEVGVV